MVTNEDSETFSAKTIGLKFCFSAIYVGEVLMYSLQHWKCTKEGLPDVNKQIATVFSLHD